MFSIATRSLSLLIFSDPHCRFFKCAHWCLMRVDKSYMSLFRKAKQIFILWHVICLLCMRRDSLIFHGGKEGQTLEIACVEHVVCTCSG